MSQILYWNDVAAGVRHATLVHASGHILLRNVPEDKVEDVKTAFKSFRDELPDVANVTEAELTGWLEDQGYTLDEGFNPPIVAYTWTEGTGGSQGGDTLQDMTVTQLKALAKDLNVEGYSGLNKAELIAAIQAAQAGGN